MRILISLFHSPTNKKLDQIIKQAKEKDKSKVWSGLLLFILSYVFLCGTYIYWAYSHFWLSTIGFCVLFLFLSELLLWYWEKIGSEKSE